MGFFIRTSFVYFGHNKSITQQRAVCMILIMIIPKRLNFGPNLHHIQTFMLQMDNKRCGIVRETFEYCENHQY